MSSFWSGSFLGGHEDEEDDSDGISVEEEFMIFAEMNDAHDVSYPFIVGIVR